MLWNSICKKIACSVNKVIFVSVLLGSSASLNIVLLIIIAIVTFLSYHNKLLRFASLLNPSASVANVTFYTYKELEAATSRFKQTIGRRAFGTVYKGITPSYPKRFIAVKKLENVEQEGEREFRTEVNAIGQTHHKNLVRLLGYCNEGHHKPLVYEYLSNGSLSSFLFGITKPHWNQRVQIAIGIARGISYLHEECSTQIIHCDIKPQNILLDDSFMPRISDFGLAKLMLAEQTRIARTNIRGTMGYFAPEWFQKASITPKVGVYSFGVVLLEIICCKSSLPFAIKNNENTLLDWVYDCYDKRQLHELVDNDDEAKNNLQRLERLMMVAVWCVQDDPSLRASMKRVTLMLEGVVDVSAPPRPSTYSLQIDPFHSSLLLSNIKDV